MSGLVTRTGLSGWTATYSSCERYRYRLDIPIGPSGPHGAFVMLNPSTATESDPDPTVSRCIGFAKGFGWSKLSVVNLYAFRTKDPEIMLAQSDPIGPYNHLALADVLGTLDPIVCAWGADAQPEQISQLLKIRDPRTRLHCLGVTKAGQPRHPLYLRKSDPLQLWEPPGDGQAVPEPGPDTTIPADLVGIPVISLWPEWLPTFRYLGKRVENRDWLPPRRLIGQRIALHAGKSVGGGSFRRGADWLTRTAAEAGYDVELIRGTKILGPRLRYSSLFEPDTPQIVSVDCGAVVATATLQAASREDDFGCRWAIPGSVRWYLTEIDWLPEPYPCSGRQGFFYLQKAA